jgi:glutaminase
MSFGEAALIDGGTRSAEVRADTQVDCGVLTREAFAAIEREHPSLAARLLRNLLRGSAETAVRLTAEVSALEA